MKRAPRLSHSLLECKCFHRLVAKDSPQVWVAGDHRQSDQPVRGATVQLLTLARFSNDMLTQCRSSLGAPKSDKDSRLPRANGHSKGFEGLKHKSNMFEDLF